MAQPKAYTIRPVSYLGTLLTLVPLALCCLAGWALTRDSEGIWTGAMVYLAYRFMFVRMVLCAEHRRGLSLTRRGEWDAAILAFAASERSWAARTWLDKHRAWVLGSASNYGFYIMARYNQAFCHARAKRGAEALALLDAIEIDSPGNTLVATLRDLLEAGQRREGPDYAGGTSAATQAVRPEQSKQVLT